MQGFLFILFLRCLLQNEDLAREIVYTFIVKRDLQDFKSSICTVHENRQPPTTNIFIYWDNFQFLENYISSLEFLEYSLFKLVDLDTFYCHYHHVFLIKEFHRNQINLFSLFATFQGIKSFSSFGVDFDPQLVEFNICLIHHLNFLHSTFEIESYPGEIYYDFYIDKPRNLRYCLLDRPIYLKDYQVFHDRFVNHPHFKEYLNLFQLYLFSDFIFKQFPPHFNFPDFTCFQDPIEYFQLIFHPKYLVCSDFQYFLNQNSSEYNPHLISFPF